MGLGDRVLGVQVCRSAVGLVATHAAPHTVRVSHFHSSKIPIAAHLKVSVGRFMLVVKVRLRLRLSTCIVIVTAVFYFLFNGCT